MTEDPRWPRAAHWLAAECASPELVVLGVPAHRTSISATQANTTPDAVRSALLRYSTYAMSTGVDVADVAVLDAGNVDEPDFDDGEARVATALRALPAHELLVALGGDNSITYSVMASLFGAELPHAGLVTFDAHFDLRDGRSNGSPVRRLVEAGLPGERIVQVGIADFANSAEYAARAREYGITVITRAEVRRRGMDDVVAQALEVAQAPAGTYVDIDVDVCDRSVVPACPAAAPGGLSADELRQAAFLCASAPGVRAVDLTEIDAAADAPDARTVRLAALLVLELAAGLASRRSAG